MEVWKIDTYKEKGLNALLMEVVHKMFLVNFSRIKEIGIHPGQSAMIDILNKNDGLTQKEIAECMHIKPPTVAVAIKRLEKIGFVVKKTDSADMRKTRIYITQEGKNAATELEKISMEIQRQVYKDFSETEICLLERFYKHMLKNLDETVDREKIEEIENMCCHKE